MARDNFSVETRKKLAERAGYICSFPGCNKLTVGPSKILKNSIVTGEAAHIEAASPKGPRFNRNQTREERISIENGIWLCNTHANIIDKDYTHYTVEEIKEWKRNHEKNIYYRQCGISPESGNIVNITIENYGPIKEGITFELYTNNIICGKNGIGKTMICDNIASLIYQEKVTERWIHGNRKFSSLFIIEFLKGRKHKIKIEITKENILNYYYNNVHFPVILPPYNVVYLSDQFCFNQFKLDALTENINDDDEYSKVFNDFYLKELLNHLNVNKDVFLSLIRYITTNEKYFICGIVFEENILKIQIESNSQLLEFSVLSGSEQQRVMLEFGIQLAKLYADISSTVLIIEQTAISTLDDELIVDILRLIINKNFNFQTIITIPDTNLLKKFPNAYDGYHFIHLIHNDKKVIIKCENSV